MNKEIIKNIRKSYCCRNDKITSLDLKAFKPYKVKRAIIVGAGFGLRMAPLTLKIPKPLVKVNGVRMIDTLLDKLVKAGIKEIYFVRGYLKDKFDELLIKYPFIKFIENDKYNNENNISSVVLACDYLENAYLCEADFMIYGDDVIKKYQYETNYLCSRVKETKDWCFDVDKDGIISNYRQGGKNCYLSYGISYWTKKDGKLLKKKILEMYSHKEYRNKLFEMCYFDIYRDEFKIHARCIDKNSIIEIDTYKELQKIDKSYK